MAKAKTSIRRKKFSASTSSAKKTLKKNTGLRISNPTQELLDEELIKHTIWECLKNGDPEGVIEVIEIYVNAVNKTQVAKENKMARSTMYHALKSKNPTINTLAKIIHACI